MWLVSSITKISVYQQILVYPERVLLVIRPLLLLRCFRDCGSERRWSGVPCETRAGPSGTERELPVQLFFDLFELLTCIVADESMRLIGGLHNQHIEGIVVHITVVNQSGEREN